MRDFSEVLRWARSSVPESEGFTTKTAAESIGVSTESVRRWFRGASMPEFSHWQMLANLIGLKPIWIVVGRDYGMTSVSKVLDDLGIKNPTEQQVDAAMDIVRGLHVFRHG